MAAAGVNKADRQQDCLSPRGLILIQRGEHSGGGQGKGADGGERVRRGSSLQGYPVHGDKTPEACRVTVRRRRAYEGRPQEIAEGAQAKPPVSEAGELKRETNWRVWTA